MSDIYDAIFPQLPQAAIVRKQPALVSSDRAAEALIYWGAAQKFNRALYRKIMRGWPAVPATCPGSAELRCIASGRTFPDNKLLTSAAIRTMIAPRQQTAGQVVPLKRPK